MTAISRRTVLLSAAAAGVAAAGPAAAQAERLARQLSGYAVNLDTWYRHVPFARRFALARAAGFRCVEFWPAIRPADTLDAAQIRRLLDENGLSVSQYAPKVPNFSDPAAQGELLTVIASAIADAKTLGCDKITVVGHALVPGMTREAMLAGYTAGLMRMAPLLEAGGVTALVEPFNTVNHPGHLLNGSRPAVAMVKAVNSPRVKLLWDFYHMQLEEGDLIDKFTAAVAQVGYVQIGDVPGRHEPGTGEINHAALIRAVRAAGYKDKIGLEFIPLADDGAAAVAAVAGLDAPL